MKLRKAAALVLVSSCIILFMFTVFPASLPMPVKAQLPEELIYEENFNDDEAQNWQRDEGWYVGGNALFVDDADNYAWARYTGEMRSADYSGLIYTFLFRGLQENFKANVRLSESSCYAVSFSYYGKNLLSLALLKLFSTNEFFTYTYTSLVEETIDYNPGLPCLVEINTEAERIMVFIRQPTLELAEVSPVIDYIDPDPIPAGSLAFEAGIGTHVEIDDIVVIGYTEPAPPPESEAPDLIVPFIDYWFEDDGRTLIFYTEIANQGNAEAQETMVSIRDESGGLLGGEAGVPVLPAGEIVAREIRLGVPESQQGTTHNILAVVDPEGRIEESNEENNRQGAAIFIPEWGGVPDGEEGWPWQWLILILLIGGAAAYSLKRLINRPSVQIRLRKDMGAQEITWGTSAGSDFEICLRSVPDAGRQSIETEGNLITGEREEENE